MVTIRTPVLLLSLLSLTHLTLADKKIFANTCGLTCASLYSESPYADCNKTIAASYELGCFCTSNILAESFALCVKTYCNGRPDVYSELSRAFCQVENFNGVKYATALELGQQKEVKFGTFNASILVKALFVWPATIFDPLYRTTDTLYYQLERGNIYGGLMVAFLGFFLVLAMARNALVKVMYFWRLPRKALSARPSKITRLFQRYIVYPAMFSGKHVSRPKVLGIYFSLPTRAQSLIILGYITIGFVCQFVSYGDREFFSDNKFFGPDYTTQLQSYIGARAGIMAFMQLPLIFLFAGRNNFMIALTGWSYTTFNVYHKWISRVMWSLAVVHGSVFTANAIRSGRLTGGYEQGWWRWGVVALICASFIMVQAVYNFRKLAYEAFLVIHVILVALMVVGMWYHCVDNGWMEYLYAAIAVWAFDRFVRLLRVMYFNFGFSGSTNAEVAVIGEEQYPILHIRVRTTRKFNFKPGQYTFLHVGAIYPWEAHPFSILEQDESGAYIFIARVHKGLTRNLYSHVLKGREDATVPELPFDAPTRNVRAGIDGPYGGPSPVHLYDTVLLVAGGVGITGIYPYIKHIIETDGATTRHIKLVWGVRHTTTMAWLQPRLERLRDLARDRLALDIHIYVSNDPIDASEESSVNGDLASPHSGASERGDRAEKVIELHHSNEHVNEVDSTYNKEAADLTQQDDELHRVTSVHVRNKRSTESLNRIPVFYQRPDLTQIVAEVVEYAPSSTAVLSCGPGTMADELRAAVCANVEACKGRLDYFEEAFEW